MTDQNSHNEGQPEFSAIVVAYNSEAHIGSTVRSLEAELSRFDYELIVVDNASSDSTHTEAAKTIQNGRAVRLEENVGYGRGANHGLRLAKGRHVMVLNDDLSVDADSVVLLRDALEADPRVALAAPNLINPAGEIQVGGRRHLPGVRNEVSRLWHRIQNRKRSLPRSGPPIEVDFVLAACLMAERETIMQIGGFSDAFFMLGEDIDLCRRVKELDRLTVFVPQAKARHDQGLAEERRARGRDHSMRVLKARDLYYRIWLSRPERSMVHFILAFVLQDQPFRFRYHFPKVLYDGPSLSHLRYPAPLEPLEEDVSAED